MSCKKQTLSITALLDRVDIGCVEIGKAGLCGVYRCGVSVDVAQ